MKDTLCIKEYECNVKRTKFTAKMVRTGRRHEDGNVREKLALCHCDYSEIFKQDLLSMLATARTFTCTIEFEKGCFVKTSTRQDKAQRRGTLS